MLVQTGSDLWTKFSYSSGLVNVTYVIAMVPNLRSSVMACEENYVKSKNFDFEMAVFWVDASRSLSLPTFERFLLTPSSGR